MERVPWKLSGVLSGTALALAIFCATTFGARALLNSELYGKSRVISMIVAQDTVGVADLAADRRNLDIVLKFAGALTSAYIDFELIPVGEAGTFAAVFESVPDDVDITRFEYRRKNLVIFGSAPDKERYDAFVAGLEGTGHFESVSGHRYDATDGTLRFELECAPENAVAAYLPFS